MEPGQVCFYVLLGDARRAFSISQATTRMNLFNIFCVILFNSPLYLQINTLLEENSTLCESYPARQIVQSKKLHPKLKENF